MTPFPSAYDIDDETRQDKTRLCTPFFFFWARFFIPVAFLSWPSGNCCAVFLFLFGGFFLPFCICSGAGVMRRYPTEFANRVGGMRSLEGLVIRVLSVASMQRRFHTCVVQRVENSLEFTHSLFRSLGVFSAPPSDMEVLS